MGNECAGLKDMFNNKETTETVYIKTIKDDIATNSVHEEAELEQELTIEIEDPKETDGSTNKKSKKPLKFE
eukprot:CAMPEP_0116946982 /NCGR_PEP_ID=MMETSP0467-20121206/37366_1 /TAXON_ID=283647 /ORGANISM="Mesodinium pulex, Strain SPMC105" /LENGTH=70 /DNA_ID=CAMNT_0004630977 /DNA_START=8 /DNA_END=220 /DNA_ORIENTATION=+